MESTWTYRESKDCRKRAFRVVFAEKPAQTQVWTSQGCVILEDVLTRKQLQATKAGTSAVSEPTWQWANSGSAAQAANQNVTDLIEARFTEFERKTDDRLTATQAELAQLAETCQQTAKYQRELHTTIEAAHAEQAQINQSLLGHVSQSGERLALLQARQDQAENSFRERLQAMQQSHSDELQRLQALLQDSKRACGNDS